MRFLILVMAAVSLGVLTPSLTVAADSGFDSNVQSVTGLIRRSTALVVSSDSVPALRTCNPADPVPGDFVYSKIAKATTLGLGGQVISGLVTNRCNATVGDLSLFVVLLDGDRQPISGERVNAQFGSLGPGQSSPFTVALSAEPSVKRMAISALPWTPLSGATADLRVQAGAPAMSGDLMTVPYVVSNAGQAPAVLPSIAGRLIGPGCTDPFAKASLNYSNQIGPGETISGSLTLPASCAGSLELMAGSKAPPAPPLPAGWSLRGAQVTYSADGKFRLFSELCNNNGSDFFLFPAPTIEFSGATSVSAKIFDSGYYPSGACQPLLAVFNDAPAGLTSARLVAIDTGDGDRQPQEGSIASTVADIREHPFLDDPFDPLGILGVPPDWDDPGDPWNDPPDDFELPDPPPLPDLIDDGFDDLPPPPPLEDGDEPLGYLVAESALASPGVAGIVYNSTSATIPAGSYTTHAIGLNPAGDVTVAVDFTGPSIQPYSWAVLQVSPGPAITGVHGQSIARWLPTVVRQPY